jgi:hypothetical protein
MERYAHSLPQRRRAGKLCRLNTVLGMAEARGIWIAALQHRTLTLDEVHAELLAELGLAGDSASTSHYSCSDSPALLTPLAEVVGPADRKLNREALISILTAIRDDVPLPPVVVFREPGASTATLLDGVHRWRASLALGFSSIPCTQPSREDAELCYRYARP